MYCATCECEFDGWIGKCPNCKHPLQEGKPPTLRLGEQQIDYETLVDIVKERGGTLKIELKTSEVGKNKATRFPWLGYGFAWTKRMLGSTDGISVELSTTKVGKDRKWKFPYQGLGYAWRQEMQGSIGGTIINLTANMLPGRNPGAFLILVMVIAGPRK